MLRAAGTSVQFHRHCKPDCTSHNSFATSLRKYSVGSAIGSSKSLHTCQSKRGRQVKSSGRSRLINKENAERKELGSQIRPFVESKQEGGIPHNLTINAVATEPYASRHYNQEIQSLILQGQRKQGNKNKQAPTNQIKWQENRPEVKHTIPEKTNNDPMLRVKQKQFKELELNVDRISKIIDMFNAKINGIQAHNEASRQSQHSVHEITSEFVANESAERSIWRQGDHQMSPILSRIQIKDIAIPVNKRNQNKEENSNQIGNSSKTQQKMCKTPQQSNDQTKLNYKMFNNWSTKSGSIASSHKGKRSKSHVLGS